MCFEVNMIYLDVKALYIDVNIIYPSFLYMDVNAPYINVNGPISRCKNPFLADELYTFFQTLKLPNITTSDVEEICQYIISLCCQVRNLR